MPTSIIDCLQEDVVKLVKFCPVCGGVAGWFVERLKSDKLRLAGQLCANLIPKPIEFLFNLGEIRTGCSNVGPVYAIYNFCFSFSPSDRIESVNTMMHIHDGVQAPFCNHIHDIRHSLEPGAINCPIRRAGHKMVNICNYLGVSVGSRLP